MPIPAKVWLSKFADISSDFTCWKTIVEAHLLTDSLKDQATETPPMPALPEDRRLIETVYWGTQTFMSRPKRRLEKLEEQAAFKGISTPQKCW